MRSLHSLRATTIPLDGYGACREENDWAFFAENRLEDAKLMRALWTAHTTEACKMETLFGSAHV